MTPGVAYGYVSVLYFAKYNTDAICLAFIQQSSITLVGELLFKVSGISGKAEIEEDEGAEDTALTESSKRALVEILGAERRDRILSALYLTRQDAVNVVRQSAGHIWKALVYNTPRTGMIIQSLQAELQS